MKTYKYLFVDWSMTLSTTLLWDHLYERTHPHHFVSTAIQSTLFCPRGMATWLLPWMRGKLMSEQVVESLCQRAHLDRHFVLQALIWSCQHMQWISEDLPEMIAQLRAKGLKVVIATDNMDTFHRWTVPSLRLISLFDDILSSFQLKALKSDCDSEGRSLFFAHYLQTHSIHREKSLLLDDEDEQFGNSIRQFGIDYQHVEPGKGIIPAFHSLLHSPLF